jgi:hypothetical protein
VYATIFSDSANPELREALAVRVRNELGWQSGADELVQHLKLGNSGAIAERLPIVF